MLTLTDSNERRAVADSPLALTLDWQPVREIAGPLTVEVRGRNLKTLITNRWESVTCEHADAEMIWRTPQAPSFNDVSAHNPCCTIGRWILPSGLSAGSGIRFLLELSPSPVSGAEIPLHVVALRGADRVETENEVIQRISAGEAIGIDLFARPAPGPAGHIRLTLLPTDANRYPTRMREPVPYTLFHGETPVWSGMLQEPTQILLPSPDADVVRYTACVDTETMAPEKRSATSNPVWPTCSTTSLPVFGEIHWHTSHSGDGMRPIREALRVSREELNLDFVAPGDHTPVGKRWEDTALALDEANEPEVFTTLFGWELSSDHGHENYYFTHADHPLLPGGKAGLWGGCPEGNTPLLDACADRFIAIPHHTNAISNETRDDGSHYWYPYPWKAPRNGYRRLLELMQCRGNFEREHAPEGWRHEYQGNGSSAQAALAAGHRFGFIAGTDNHTGWPTLNTFGKGSRLYAGAWVAARTREAIFEALYDRHTWACWDTRAIVRFTINGALQGSDLAVKPGTRLHARIQLSCEASLESLEVVTIGDVATPVPFETEAMDLDVTVALPAAVVSTWYYLRARQTDGALIYASPVFIDI